MRYNLQKPCPNCGGTGRVIYAASKLFGVAKCTHCGHRSNMGNMAMVWVSWVGYAKHCKCNYCRNARYKAKG